MSEESPDPDLELVAVFRISDPGLTALAKSILDGEGIEYMVRGEDVQDLFGYGRLFSFNIVTGPAEFLVRREDEARAVELLRDLVNPSETTETDQ